MTNQERDKTELVEAKRQIDSTLHKLREVVKTFEKKEEPSRYKSQIPLPKRLNTDFDIPTPRLQVQLKQPNTVKNRGVG